MWRQTLPIVHACGHPGSVDYFDSRSRTYKRREAERLICVECAEAEDGRPKLQGSPRQVAWARTLRARALAGTQRLQQKHLAEWRAAGQDWAIVALQRAAEALRGQTSARWWIEGRGARAVGLIVELEPRLREELAPPGA